VVSLTTKTSQSLPSSSPSSSSFSFNHILSSLSSTSDSSLNEKKDYVITRFVQSLVPKIIQKIKSHVKDLSTIISVTLKMAELTAGRTKG
jgi:hypothetical protein